MAACDPYNISVKSENLRIVVISVLDLICNFGSKFVQTTLAGWNFGTKGSCSEGTNHFKHIPAWKCKKNQS